MSLERFKEAQDKARGGFETAVGELRAGRKTSHWIWYIFPQLGSLGQSATAQFYGLRDGEEARDYARDPLLRERLVAATEAVAEKLAEGEPLVQLMGGAVDSLKVVSSLTLFEIVVRRAEQDDAELSFELARLRVVIEAVLGAAEKQGMGRCAVTVAECGGDG